jgi:hypothetical protein
MPSQSTHPDEQVTTLQEPEEQVDWLVLGKEQAAPHAPQFDALESRLVSQPLE